MQRTHCDQDAGLLGMRTGVPRITVEVKNIKNIYIYIYIYILYVYVLSTSSALQNVHQGGRILAHGELGCKATKWRINRFSAR
jgi:hypothetical protein